MDVIRSVIMTRMGYLLAEKSFEKVGYMGNAIPDGRLVVGNIVFRDGDDKLYIFT